MIISGTIVLDADGQAATCRDLQARLAGLDDRRRAAAGTVASLLQAWHGDAADRFGEQWQEWDEGAAGVLDALGGSLTAIDLARADLVDTDGRRGGSVAALAGAARMTAYDVDLDELRSAVATLASCQRDLLALAGDVDALQLRLQGSWAGRARDAQQASHAAWRDDCAAMVTALAALRGIASGADEHYSSAVAANLALWHAVAP